MKKRKGILDGVCISGGEPTLSDGLEEFLGKIKELGYAVKLDTNGSRPKIVKHLAEAGLIDKIAMDIKACPDNYGNLAGIEKPDMDSIFETADFLLHGNLDYEFRTTVVRELHTQKDFEEIAGWLAGAKEYYLQLIRTQTESSGLDMEAILLRTSEFSEDSSKDDFICGNPGHRLNDTSNRHAFLESLYSCFL